MSFYHALLGRALAGGGGGSEPVLISKSISENGIYDASDDNANGYSSVSVSVPNTYTQSDEGKVVSNGALVTQGSDTVEQNGTVDTTLISSLIVNVPSAGGDFAALTPVNTTDFESDLYICIPTNSSIGFVFGQLTTKHRPSTSDSTAEFYLPESFPASKIGSLITGVRASPNSTYAQYVKIYKTESNTIKLLAGSPWYDNDSYNPYTLIAPFNVVI